eukprot:gene7093-5027_t
MLYFQKNIAIASHLGNNFPLCITEEHNKLKLIGKQHSLIIYSISSRLCFSLSAANLSYHATYQKHNFSMIESDDGAILLKENEKLKDIVIGELLKIEERIRLLDSLRHLLSSYWNIQYPQRASRAPVCSVSKKISQLSPTSWYLSTNRAVKPEYGKFEDPFMEAGLKCTPGSIHVAFSALPLNPHALCVGHIETRYKVFGNTDGPSALSSSIPEDTPPGNAEGNSAAEQRDTYLALRKDFLFFLSTPAANAVFSSFWEDLYELRERLYSQYAREVVTDLPDYDDERKKRLRKYVNRLYRDASITSYIRYERGKRFAVEKTLVSYDPMVRLRKARPNLSGDSSAAHTDPTTFHVLLQAALEKVRFPRSNDPEFNELGIFSKNNNNCVVSFNFIDILLYYKSTFVWSGSHREVQNSTKTLSKLSLAVSMEQPLLILLAKATTKGMPVAPPSLSRALLRTFTDADYKDIISRRAGEFSLQAALLAHHKTIELHEILPRTAEYPQMQVVDLIPATLCTIEDEATFVLLPPVRQEESSAPLVADTKLNDKKSLPDTHVERLVCVQFNSQLQCDHAFGNREFFEQFLLETESVVEVSSSSFRSVFAVQQVDTASDSRGMRLEVSGIVFQNIRRAAAALCLTSPHVEINFRDSQMMLPMDWFRVLDRADGEVMLPSDIPIAKKISVCPAMDDFLLQMLFGESYGDLLALSIEAAVTTVLNDRIVSENDILLIPVGPPNGQYNRQVSGAEALETVGRIVRHKTNGWDGIFVNESNQKITNFFPVRIAAVETSDGRTFGRTTFQGDTITQLGFVSQVYSPCLGYFSPLYPPTSGFLCEVEFKQKIRNCLDSCFHGKGGNVISVFVAQGVPENLPSEFIEDTGLEYGVLTTVASMEGLSDAESTLLLQKFVDQRAPLILILRGAQKICSESPHLLPMFDVQSRRIRSSPKAIFLVCETIDAVPPVLSARAQNTEGVILCGNPSEEDRFRILDWSIKKLCSTHEVHHSCVLSLKALASWTTGLSVADILAFVSDCVSDSKCMTTLPPHVQPVLSDVSCETVLQRYLNAHGHNLVSTKLQPVRWSDVGGLKEAKQELQETIQLPILHPELFANGIKRRAGILFYGPPGCGKTLLAKAVATEMNMNFMSVKGPELINQYVGESERNIRILFQKARDNSPCIVFFDELDALAPARGAKGDGGGAMDRIVSQLLVEVDGVGQKRSDGTDCGQVFIIGATNRPDLLDPSLLRPGRFDRLCYLGIPSSKEEQLYAVRALTRKFVMDPDVSLDDLIEPLECVYTGADLFALCSDAMMNAVNETLDKFQAELSAAITQDDVGAGESQEEEEREIRVSMRHFLKARDNLKASVTREDLVRYEALKRKFS